MEDCRTPTHQHTFDYKVTCTPTTINTSKSDQIMMNTLNICCSTPNNYRSPGVSPINCIKSRLKPGMPINAMKSNNNNSNKKRLSTKTANDLRMRSLGINNCFTPSPNINVSSTSISPMFDISGDSSGIMETSTSVLNPAMKSFSILNRTLSVFLLLKNVGLEEYADVFEGFDMDKFLSIDKKDLKRMGLHSEEHCKIIIDLLRDLNGL